MARDFLAKHDVVGMKRAEIERILGPADFGDYWSYTLELGPDVKTHLGNPVRSPKLGIRFRTGFVKGIDLPFPRSAVEQSDFNIKHWQSASFAERAALVWDLHDQALLDGVSKEQVHRILGQPEDGIPADRIAYDLGMYPWLMEIDGYGLEFQLDDNNEVTRGYVVQY